MTINNKYESSIALTMIVFQSLALHAGGGLSTARKKQAAAVIAGCTALQPAKFLLPDEVRTAWLMQSREIWSKLDKLGAGLADKPDGQSATAALEMTPLVKRMMNGYIRYQLT